MKKALLLTATLGIGGTAAQANVYITEWMYNPASSVGEFVELTNLGSTVIDTTGWSFDDDSQTPGGFDLSGFGTITPGESVIFTQATVEDFRAEWNLSASVKVLGGVANNLGRADQINIFDGLGALIDVLTYGDQTIPGTIRTAGISGNPNSNAALGIDDVTQWSLSSIGDSFGSYASFNGDIANPGSFPVPEPASLALLGLAGALVATRRRHA